MPALPLSAGICVEKEKEKTDLRRMTEFSPTSSFASEVKNEFYNNANKMNSSSPNHPNAATVTVFGVIICILCFLGLLGNGKVIWILGFHTKRNYFSINVLNLAVADSGVLIMEALMQISLILEELEMYYTVLLLCFLFYNITQLLLISISVDRCVSVLFPIWQQSHRPPKLSLTVCAIAWILPMVCFILGLNYSFVEALLLFQVVFSWGISYPVMVTSTLILFLKIKQLQLKRKKALKLTLLALICFIVFHLPLGILFIMNYIELKQNNLHTIVNILIGNFTTNVTKSPFGLYILALLSNNCIAVNSSINPIIYFLAGRNKETRSSLSMKHALQRIFRKEDDTKEDEMQPDEM